ncbi:hypothetical protein REPUB_Repub15cG0031400 [Reevesia pubescens]
MASMVLKGSSSSGSQVSPLISIQEKGSRNKRKFWANPPLGDPNKILISPQNGCPSYEFWAEKFEISPVHVKSAIKKIVAYGYTEEIATKALLRSGLCYGCNDTVSNIVDNTLAFLRSGQDSNPSRDHCFEDLQQLEKYILVELVCALREVHHFFSTGDAMWCLMICDMNLLHACAMDGDPLSGFVGDGASNEIFFTSNQPQLKIEAKTSELNLPNPCRPISSIVCSHSSLPEVPSIGINNPTKSKNSLFISGIVPEKEGTNSISDSADKSFSAVGTSQSSTMEEKFVSSRNIHSTKREYIFRQKSLNLEKNYRTYGSKGSSRAKLSGLGALILDKKLKSVSDSAAVNIKSASLKIKAMGADVPQDNESHNLSINSRPSSSATFCLDNGNNISVGPKTNIAITSPPVNVPPELPPINNLPALSTADTELSLSLPTKSNSIVMPLVSHSEAATSSYAGMPYDKSLGQWVSQDKKDEMILKLVPRMREL